MKEFCMRGYNYIVHGLLSIFVERWYANTSPFHLPIGEMTITFDHVSFLLHLPIIERLLDHSRISKLEALGLMVT